MSKTWTACCMAQKCPRPTTPPSYRMGRAKRPFRDQVQRWRFPIHSRRRRGSLPKREVPSNQPNEGEEGRIVRKKRRDPTNEEKKGGRGRFHEFSKQNGSNGGGGNVLEKWTRWSMANAMETFSTAYWGRRVNHRSSRRTTICTFFFRKKQEENRKQSRRGFWGDCPGDCREHFSTRKSDGSFKR